VENRIYDKKIEILEICVEKLVNIGICPFCAEKPSVMRVKDTRYSKEGEMNWVIQCKSMGCIFNGSSPNRSLNALLDEWNIRRGV
jgi:hypothetical protein